MTELPPRHKLVEVTRPPGRHQTTIYRTRCGQELTAMSLPDHTTVWEQDVTCPDCNIWEDQKWTS